MFRKIVISVLVILAGVIASAGIASLAGWHPHYGWRTYEPYGGYIGVSEGYFSVSCWPEPVHLVSSFRLANPWMGFEYYRWSPYSNSEWVLGAQCPFWFPVLLLAAYPILVLIKTNRGRPKLGHCSKCGYNLTGLPEPRCPECGTEFER